MFGISLYIRSIIKTQRPLTTLFKYYFSNILAIRSRSADKGRGRSVNGDFGSFFFLVSPTTVGFWYLNPPSGFTRVEAFPDTSYSVPTAVQRPGTPDFATRTEGKPQRKRFFLLRVFSCGFAESLRARSNDSYKLFGLPSYFFALSVFRIDVYAV